MISEYLKNNILITDGAMGTYYSELTGDYDSFCEFANIEKPEIISEIHNKYIEAGSKLIRTNTFSANSITLNITHETLKEIIESGVEIADAAAKAKNVFVAASIGPIPETPVLDNDNSHLEEYKFIADCFLKLGVNIFMFETFSSVNYLKEISQYIKEKNPEAYVITQFAIMPNEYTRDGVSINNIIEEVQQIGTIDTFGFNCASSPTHLYKMLKNKDIFKRPVSVLPNAGYPELVNERMVYFNNPNYFANKMLYIKKLGAKIIGGCCGTTPAHIESLVKNLDKDNGELHIDFSLENPKKVKVHKKENLFIEKLLKKQFVVAVELDPPLDTDVEKILEGAKICKNNEVDLVTVADSPMSKVRVDSVMMAAKIKREIGIDTMPHICCRDKNINALRASLLAAHIEGIRNILGVTGDPVSSAEKQNIKNVFNLNSYKLIELISSMNKETFIEDRINIGAALNLNVINKENEVERMKEKIARGADFFLTQPIYDEKTIEFLANMKKDSNVKILAGILPIVSYRNAEFLNNELPGVHIPQIYIDRFSEGMPKEEAEEKGIELALEIAEKFIGFVDGVYVMTPFNRFEMVAKIIRKIKKQR